VWLEQTCRAQPCAQRLEIATALPQELFESIAPPDERKRVNSLPPNGRGKSAVVHPRCQGVSGEVVPTERVRGRDSPRRHRDHGPEWRTQPESRQSFSATETQRGAAGGGERHVGPELQRESEPFRARESPAMQREQCCDRGGGVGAATPQARLRGDALGEREARTAGK
jgi:hypothetical protein